MTWTPISREDWRRQVEPGLRNRGFATIDNDPRVLFETDGGPGFLKADMYLARLIGPNDEIVDDEMHLPSAMYELRVPRREPVSVWLNQEAPTYPMLKVDLYLLQSNYATMKLDAQYAPEGCTPGPGFMIDLAFLRYRRKLQF